MGIHLNSETIMESCLECPICLNAVSDERTTLPCAHTMCSSCLSTWLATPPCCPLCRSAVFPDHGKRTRGSASGPSSSSDRTNTSGFPSESRSRPEVQLNHRVSTESYNRRRALDVRAQLEADHQRRNFLRQQNRRVQNRIDGYRSLVNGTFSGKKLEDLPRVHTNAEAQRVFVTNNRAAIASAVSHSRQLYE